SVKQGAAAAAGRIEFCGERTVDDPEHELPGGYEPEGDAPEGDAGQEIVGAVDRIDHPDGACVRIARAALLTEETVHREEPREAANDEILALAVGIADEVLRPLAVDVKEL